jgi:hypothetical protein
MMGFVDSSTYYLADIATIFMTSPTFFPRIARQSFCSFLFFSSRAPLGTSRHSSHCIIYSRATVKEQHHA